MISNWEQELEPPIPSTVQITMDDKNEFRRLTKKQDLIDFAERFRIRLLSNMTRVQIRSKIQYYFDLYDTKKKREEEKKEMNEDDVDELGFNLANTTLSSQEYEMDIEMSGSQDVDMVS